MLTLGLLGVLMVLSWIGFSSTYVVFPDLVLREKCAALGIPNGQCSSAHPSFLEAQSEQTAFMALYCLLTNIPCSCLCAFYAHISDCRGRKSLCLVSCIQGVAIYGLIALQGLTGPWMLAIVVALNCLSGSIYGATGIMMAAAADVTTGWSPTDRARMFSRMEGCIWLGQFIGPTCGGVVANLIGPQHALLVPSALSAATLLLTLALLPETLPHEQRLRFSWKKANPLGGLAVARHFPSCVVLIGGMLFAQWAISSGVTTWPLFCKRELDWADGTTGALESVFFMANAVGLAFVMPFLAGRISAKSILMTAGVSAVAMWSLFASAVEGWHMFAIACIGTANAMMYPIIRTSLITILGPQLHGAALGVIALVELVCQTGAPTTANATWHLLEVRGWPDHAAFGIVAAELVVALAVFSFVPGGNLISEHSCNEARLCETQA